MAELFLDSAALIAHVLADDRHHPAAEQFLNGLPPGRRFHLSNYIFDETLTRVQRRAGHDAAVTVARLLCRSPLYVIHQITEDLQEEALEIFLGQGRQGLSFTDCTTAALMRRMEITDIFTFDRDLAALGLTVRP